MEPEARSSLARWLALNRTVGVVLITVLVFGLGEELWESFMPMYLKDQTKTYAETAEAGASVPWEVLIKVGIYACLINFMEGFCYIGGGQLTARLGDRGSLILFAVLTLSGYGLFLSFPTTTWAAILAALLILGWEPLSVPVTFTTVGSTVSKKQQGMAFAIQSIQKRLPKIIGPAIAGLVLYLAGQSAEQLGRSSAEGRLAATRLLVGVSFLLGLISLAIQVKWMPHRPPALLAHSSGKILREFPLRLRRLLLAELFTRWCDWLVRKSVVLYVILVRGVSFRDAGLLFALQHVVALLTYLPIGRWTQSVGLQPFIGVTFIFFALFPLVLALVPDNWIALAFVVYGLREIGEPARKALITSLLPEEVRARGVGLYWGLRSFAICWASLVGAVSWFYFGPEMLLYIAFALGCAGAGVFYLFCRSR